MVSLNRSAGLALGIDFGHRHLRVAVSDLSHTVLAETWRETRRRPLRRARASTAAAEFVDQVLDEAERRPRPRDRRRHGPPGADRSRDRRGRRRPRSCPAGSASTRPPRRARASGCRSRSRTTPTSARSPSSSGVPAKGKSEVAYIKVSTGIGAGLISRRAAPARGRRHGGRDRPHRDRRGRARVPVRQPRLPRDARLDPGDRRAAQRQPRRADLDAAGVLELCAAGDAAAQRLIGDAGRAIGIAVANLCNLLNPECVIVGGDLSAAGRDAARAAARHGSPQRDPERGRGPRDRRRRARRARRAARGAGAGDARVGPVHDPGVGCAGGMKYEGRSEKIPAARHERARERRTSDEVDPRTRRTVVSASRCAIACWCRSSGWSPHSASRRAEATTIDQR